MNLATLVAQLIAQGALNQVANIPGLQLGVPGRQYLGATVLPTRNVPENYVRADDIRYRTMLANTGTRYSPVTLRGGAMVGSLGIELGELDTGSEFTSVEYDALLRLLAQGGSMEGTAQVLDWVTRTLALPIQERIEKQRWEAIDDAQVVREGDNGYAETVGYPNPSGHRVTIASGSTASPTGWYDDTHDPLDDVDAQIQLLSTKGYLPGRIITSRKLVNVLLRHPKIRTYTAGLAVANNGSIVSNPGRVTLGALNGYFAENGWPAIEVYDLTARKSDGTTVRFKRDTAFTILAQTGRPARVDLPDDIRLLPDTLGYAAIGRAAGQATPGIVVRAEVKDNKPPRIEGEAWATAAPIILDPEAITVLNVPDRS